MINTILSIRILRFPLLVISFYFLTSCMMAGMHLNRAVNNSEIMDDTIVDTLITKAINILSSQEFQNIETIGVGRIETNSNEINLEQLRQKVINSLVNTTDFKVISRKHLDELLTEQSLSLSGLTDTSDIENIGKIKGLDGLITGYLNRTKNIVELNINLIRTSTGQVIWTQQLNRILR